MKELGKGSVPSRTTIAKAVKFDLQFVPINSDTKAQSFATQEKTLTDTKADGGVNVMVGGKFIANSLILTDDATFESIPSVAATATTWGVSPSKVLGITDVSEQHINIPEKSRGNLKTVIHEIFHTLKFNKDGKTSGIAGGKKLPNASEINTLIKGLQKNKQTVDVTKKTKP